MSALRDLHRKLHSIDNKALVERKNSLDDYSTKETNREKSVPDKNNSDNLKLKNKEEEISKDTPNKEENQLNEIPLDSSQENSFFKRNIKIILITFLSLIFLVVAGVFYVKYKQGSFEQENVLIEFQGNKEVRSGEKLAQKLIINNNNRTALKNTKIKIIFPEELRPVQASFIESGPAGSFYINTGDMKKFEKKEYELQFEVYSSFDSQIYLNTEFSYMPENFSSNFLKETSHLFDIKGSVVSFSLVSQQEAAFGETVKFIGVLNNNSDKDFDNLILEIDKNNFFQFENSGLEKFSESDNRFRIPKLKPGEKREIDISGGFTGEINSIQRFLARIGTLDENKKFLEISSAEESVRIIPSRITITQEINAELVGDNLVTGLGENLSYVINFKNNTSSPLTDLVLTEKLEGVSIDESKIKVNDGYYDQAKKEITWKASEIPALKILNPGESGSATFKFNTKKDFFAENKKNHIITSRSRISSLNINSNLLGNKEISSEKEEVKVKTNLEVLTFGSFDDTIFDNYGPVPVVSGEETSITIKVDLKNNFNKVRDFKMLIKLPSGITWKDKISKSSGEVNFNPRANELTWNVKAIEPGVGYDKPVEELLFQIAVNPQVNQTINDIKLINSITLNGYEEFIEEKIYLQKDGFEINNVSENGF